MDTNDAKRRIARHIDSRDGVVGCLRPYRRVPEAYFAELLQAMIVLHPIIVAASAVDRKLVADLWSICYQTRGVALRPNSAIRRDSLETDDALIRLADWINAIEKFSIGSLKGHDLWFCMSPTIEIIADAKLDDPKKFEFVLPFLVEFKPSDDKDFAATVARAISALTEQRGPAANDHGSDHEGVPVSDTARAAIEKIKMRAGASPGEDASSPPKESRKITRTIHDSVTADVNEADRKHVQETFGRHLVEQRNRVAALVRRWIETDARFPAPIYDRLFERVKRLDASIREDIASISLLVADEIVTGILATFSRGDEMRVGDKAVNYAIVAQFRLPNADDLVAEADVNRGEPIIAIWDHYRRWLNRFAPSDLRPRSDKSEDETEVRKTGQ